MWGQYPGMDELSTFTNAHILGERRPHVNDEALRTSTESELMSQKALRKGQPKGLWSCLL